MINQNPTRPGDLLLDRYLAGACPATREAARLQWKRFVGTLLRVATRIGEEESEAVDSPNSDRRRRIPSLP